MLRLDKHMGNVISRQSGSARKPWPSMRPAVEVTTGRQMPPLMPLLVRLVPFCFVLGAGMELFMEKVPIGGRTFYDVATQKEAERQYERRRVQEIRAERAAARAAASGAARG
eukprot:SAG22_NODE_242_length_14104_cov_13.581935_9_plen_112_part_00